MRARVMLWGFLGMVWLLPGLLCAQTVPNIPRTGPNLLSNMNLNGTSSWTLSGGAVYDSSLTKTADGSGSIRLPVGTQARVDSAVVAVTPGHIYMFAAYIRTGAWPPGQVMFFYTNFGSTFGGQSNPGGNSQSGIWEEFLYTIIPDAGVTSISVAVIRGYHGDAGVSDMWIDEFYLGEGIGFDAPAAAKTPFTGSLIQVDALGNFSVKLSGTFQPFFPFCLMGDGSRPNYHQVYSNQGFNCDGRSGSSAVADAALATSSFNPYGMVSAIDVTSYMWPDSYGWDPSGVNLTNEIHAAKASYPEHLVYYYWDNENEWAEWTNPMNAIAFGKTADTVSGSRQVPFFILQGSFNASRMYRSTAGVVAPDITGTYAAAGQTGGASGGAGALVLQQHLQNQTSPVTIYQANIVSVGTGVGYLRAILYAGLTFGARGLSLWRDCYQENCSGYANSVTSVDWWPDVPYLRQELDAMLPLIRQPHWTSWTASFNTALPLTVGTRDYNGLGHIIIANSSGSPVSVTFTLSGLGYVPTVVKDYFSGSTVTSVSGSSFTVSIPASGLASGTAVLQLSGTAPPAGTLRAKGQLLRGLLPEEDFR